MSTRVIRFEIVRALRDAMAWQDSIMDAHSHIPKDPQYKQASKTKERYRALLARLQADPRTIEEMVRDEMAALPTVTIQQLYRDSLTAPTPRKRKRPTT